MVSITHLTEWRRIVDLTLLFGTRSFLPDCSIANQLPSPRYCKEQVTIYRIKD
jgi:hypothetical protein